VQGATCRALKDRLDSRGGTVRLGEAHVFFVQPSNSVVMNTDAAFKIATSLAWWYSRTTFSMALSLAFSSVVRPLRVPPPTSTCRSQ